ncbi:MAG: hypothetical protein A2X12_02440 [Bacteroidetes bacterium GWE2_29_8]|nr:MAG: hypothetical protein A2X12_02440 [Bacteroidetes bacterium GWE2_29_8]OFY14626.1 MAG: hypothetical protein A2X02_06030 [Bacteroidetes bacterium GWF2_29_10]
MKKVNKNDILLVFVSLLLGISIGAATLWSYYNKSEENYLSLFHYYRMIGRIADNINAKYIENHDNINSLNANHKKKLKKIDKKEIIDSLILIKRNTAADSIFYDSIGSYDEEMYVDKNYDDDYNQQNDNDSVRKIASNVDDMVVLKDVMIYEKTLEIKGLNIQKEIENLKIESLVSGNSNNKNPVISIKIEFWVSPINYKGYKMSRKKIVLFGIKDFENISVKKLNQKYFIQIHKQYFYLEYTDDYKKLIPENDEKKIKELDEII